MFKIFNTILSTKFKEGFADTIVTKSSKFTSMILEIYEKSKLNFLPLPSKIHYMFNLRDVSKIVQGVCQVSSKTCTSFEHFAKVIVHEIWRILGDKLNTQEDRMFLL